jgi:hypothetical protein
MFFSFKYIIVFLNFNVTLNLKAPNLRMNSKVKNTVKMMLKASSTSVYSCRIE